MGTSTSTSSRANESTKNPRYRLTQSSTAEYFMILAQARRLSHNPVLDSVSINKTAMVGIVYARKKKKNLLTLL